MSDLPRNGKTPAGHITSAYERYHIATQNSPDVDRWPSRFNVKVRRSGLAKLLVKELLHYGPRKDVILSRPCMYGVFSGPVGGFMPREEHCVGCLRCTTEFPDFVRVEHNPERRKLGDSHFKFNYVDAVSYEAASGLIPVKGAGYRGKFGGEGWDGMWTDMSEIVRPTRDGIHGREFISTVVDIGHAPNFLLFDESGQPYGVEPRSFPLPLPILYDRPPESVMSEQLVRILARAASQVGTVTVVPIDQATGLGEFGEAIAPLVTPEDANRLSELDFAPQLIEMQGWNESLFVQLGERFPESLIGLRTHFEDPGLVEYAEAGVSVFHLTADFHGRGESGAFVLDMIREAHGRFVESGIRQEVTLIGSGGLIAAEHVPKAILCGLDAVALDTPILVALQARFVGECADRMSSPFRMPEKLDEDWGVQRVMNLTGSWRDQLLEILGAMGLREVRRLRGEMGRAMFMKTLEVEAFAGIEGYDGKS
ncbi:MAG: glutamate synthase-related protein [Chloroflexi bacterium]|nr:glutamate synthase-related protein [Chloroflexota bacterium]